MVTFSEYSEASVELIKIRSEIQQYQEDIREYDKEEARLARMFDDQSQQFREYIKRMDNVEKGPNNDVTFARIDAVDAWSAERRREINAQYGGTWDDLQKMHEGEARRLWLKRADIEHKKSKMAELEKIVSDFEGQAQRYESDQNAELAQLIAEIKGLADDL